MSRQRFKRWSRILKLQKQLLKQMELQASSLHRELQQARHDLDDLSNEMERTNREICSSISTPGSNVFETSGPWFRLLQQRMQTQNQYVHDKQQAWQAAQDACNRQRQHVESLSKLCGDLAKQVQAWNDKQTQIELLDFILAPKMKSELERNQA